MAITQWDLSGGKSGTKVGKEIMNKEVIKVEGVARQDGDFVRLLTGDMVALDVTEFGKSLGIDGLLHLNAIRSVIVHIKAGDVGYIDVECYGTVNDVRKRTRGKPAGKAAVKERCGFQDGLATYVVRFPLMSMAVTAFGPIGKAKRLSVRKAGKKAK